jgi:zinc protease
MRYAIMRNATPPGQASLRLRFDVGSLMERDDQRGLAHFLEHMAFNGSANLPGRYDILKTLERLGLAFGADTNAQTGFDSTVYKFDLPKADATSVDTAVMLLREIAGNLTIDPHAIDQERGVILSEERQRDVPSYRVTKSRTGFLMDGLRPPSRFPIGLAQVIQTAQRDRIADIYQRYYRPARATLIAVGDFDPDAMEAKIKARFGDWNGQGAPGDDPDLGRVSGRGPDFKLSVEPGAPATLDIAWVGPPDLTRDTQAKRRQQMIERLGLAVLNRRLATLSRTVSPPFLAATALHGDELRAEEITAIDVSIAPDQWKSGLAAADAEVRRILKYGVRPDELAREIAEQEAQLKLAAAGAATRPTPQMADEIASTLDERLVETSPDYDLALFEATIKDLKPAAVDTALKPLFQGGGPLVFLASPRPVEGGATALKAAFEADRQTPVTAPGQVRPVDWPYKRFGAPGKVADRQQVADLGATFVRFGNGVRLTLKATRFRDKQVLVKVRFGDGLEGLAPDRQSMTWARYAFAEGGLKRISADDAERALAGASYGVDFGAEADAFTLAGATRPSDLATQLQVLAAYLSDPGWRPEAFQRLKTFGQTLEDQYAASDGGVLSRDLPGLLHAGDRRWTFPSRNEIEAETPDELKAQIAPALAAGPVEVDIVGDIDVDATIQAVAATFGALPPRPAPSAPAPPAHTPRFPAPVSQPLVLTHNGRADQGIAFVAWPTDDFFADLPQTRANAVLGEVLQLRLIDVLRLEQAVTYSPFAGASASTVFPHWGYIDAEMEAPPDKLDGFFDDVAKVAAKLRAEPPEADELARAKTPAIQGLEKAMATNEYWLAGLSGAETDPRRLAALRTAEADLERVTAADVQKAAETYLRDETAWKLEIRPQAPAKVAQATGASTN